MSEEMSELNRSNDSIANRDNSRVMREELDLQCIDINDLHEEKNDLKREVKFLKEQVENIRADSQKDMKIAKLQNMIVDLKTKLAESQSEIESLNEIRKQDSISKRQLTEYRDLLGSLLEIYAFPYLLEESFASDVMPVTKASHNKYKYEFNRLRTFNTWLESAPIAAERLARAGFYYSGDNQSVTCFECGGRITEWSSEDTAITKHRQYFPECKFVIGNSDNIPLVVPKVSKVIDSSMMQNRLLIDNSDESESIFNNSRNCINRRSDLDMSSFYQLMKNERNRLKSFFIRDNSRWSLPNVRPEDLAKAGFFFLNDDRVQCAFCRGVIADWSEGDRPLAEHAKHFPFCPFIMEEDVGNIPIGSDPIRSPCFAVPVFGHDVCGNRDTFEETATNLVKTNGRNGSQPINMNMFGIQPYSGPINPEMGPLEARKKSFLNSGWDQNIPVSPDKLAQAGFYYIGYSDAVKCFHCGGGLTDWEAGDNPWVEHAMKYPKCHFLNNNKSQSFIAKCARLEHNENQSNVNHINTSDEITVCRIVDQWMSSDIVQQLISINTFSIDLIKATLNDRYYSCRKPFKSFADLYEAIRESDNHLNDNLLSQNEMPSFHSPSEENTTSNSISSSTSTSVSSIAVTCNEVITRPIEENESRLLCKICFLKEIGVVFLPCGHQMACNECAQRLTDCVICRQLIRGYVKTFFS